MEKGFTNIRSLLGAFARALNLINRDTQHHHEQTAYIAYRLAQQMGFDEDALYVTTSAALMHDIGSVIAPETETDRHTLVNRKQLAKIGAHMLRDIPGFEHIADIIEVNQNTYAENLALLGECVDLDISQALNLADFVATFLRSDIPVLNQVKGLTRRVEGMRGDVFSPKAVDAFLAISRRECLWMDLALNPAFLLNFTGSLREVSLNRLRTFTRLMSRVIDFRSPFTAMHSAGVAASASILARLAGMSEDEVLMMEAAGNLHDVGKLRVPGSILEKPGRLTEEEFNIMKEHPYYTRMILDGVEGFGKIADWASYHHENLNGTGYPFHLTAKALDTGARIMAVADIFSAIAEVRPYRAGMDRTQAMGVLKDGVTRGELCGRIVDLLENHYDEVDAAREAESRAVGQRYYQSLAIKNHS